MVYIYKASALSAVCACVCEHVCVRGRGWRGISLEKRLLSHVINWTIYTFATSQMTTATTEPTELMDSSVCSALEQIAYSAFQNNVTCFTNLNCDGLECDLTPLGPDLIFPATALILHCLDPPAVQLNLKGSDGSTLIDKRIAQSTTIEMFGITVLATLDQLPTENAIGFQVCKTSKHVCPGLLDL